MASGYAWMSHASIVHIEAEKAERLDRSTVYRWPVWIQPT
jgi:hypothetical protein